MILEELKQLNPKALDKLAERIRKFLIRSISDTGGHLASNLGVVELTLALHAVLNSPEDKIVWDVGHQSYVHKILTDRKDRFHELRKLDGLSGFPKPHESEHDAFGTGHSSTAISAALGLATARDLRGENHKVVAVVGDGSMTGGLAYEGLNNAGRAGTDILVILNDNEMSISQNVGAISRHLNEIRTASSYLGAKNSVRNALSNLPVVGGTLSKGIESVKDFVRYAVLPSVLFEELGFKYFGLIDGHDIASLISTLKKIKKIKGPVLLHVHTTKGKGYIQAEHSPSSFHGVGKFNVETGKPTTSIKLPSYTDIFSRAICQKATADKSIVAITAAMADGTGLEHFKHLFPDRFFDVGIAESHAVTFAAGLAMGGMRPVVAIYSSFMQRAYDQVVHDVAIQKLPIVFMLDRAGAVPEDGETHQGLYDFAYFSHIPGIMILAPSSATELEAMFTFALQQNSPVVIRYPKDTAPDIPLLTPIVLGKSETVVKGENIAIVFVGAMRGISLEIVEKLRGKGYNPSLYNARFVKPISPDLSTQLTKYKYVFTIEDATKIGGYGSMLKAINSNVYTLGFPDSFIEAGTRAELFNRHGLDSTSLAEKIEQIYKESLTHD